MHFLGKVFTTLDQSKCLPFQPKTLIRAKIQIKQQLLCTCRNKCFLITGCCPHLLFWEQCVQDVQPNGSIIFLFCMLDIKPTYPPFSYLIFDSLAVFQKWFYFCLSSDVRFWKSKRLLLFARTVTDSIKTDGILIINLNAFQNNCDIIFK